jgi:prepilin-type N-terminal cleavage/methylation domain-containing protein
MRTRRFAADGFTFFEVMVVIVILGLLFSIGAVSLTPLVPKYRLRSSLRELGSTLEHVRLMAISRGLWMGVHYVLTPGPTEKSTSYYQIIPPAPDDDPDQPVENREYLSKQYLPTGVHIARVLLAGNQVVDRGAINVLFSPMGNSGSHIVVLEDDANRGLSLKLNAITGGIDFIEGAGATFQHFEE